MAEWLKAPVLKTGEGQTSVGSNPTLSAKNNRHPDVGCLLFFGMDLCRVGFERAVLKTCRGHVFRPWLFRRKGIPLSPPKQKHPLRVLFSLAQQIFGIRTHGLINAPQVRVQGDREAGSNPTLSALAFPYLPCYNQPNHSLGGIYEKTNYPLGAVTADHRLYRAKHLGNRQHCTVFA